MSDTIFALATAPGRGGVAVVRVSGPAAWQAARNMTTRPLPPPRHAALRTLVDPVSRETIDHALIIVFQGPASFTGEDCVEFHVHGGRAVIASLEQALSGQSGIRPAGPGEFTRRGFENGRLDLTEAEAIADLVNAETQAQKEQALLQMGGALSQLYQGWTDRLSRLLAHMEADLDFPEDDLPEGLSDTLRTAIVAISAEIGAHLKDHRRGERLRNGIRIAIIGAPNAGKSSLLNCLAQREAAIVSPVAGTTRDIIDVPIDLGGFPVILTDTAGLRLHALGNEGHDVIEREGIRRAVQAAEQADFKILLFDSGQEPDQETLSHLSSDALIVLNKADICERSVLMDGLSVSALTGQGIDQLLDRLTQEIRKRMGDLTRPAPSRERHRTALAEAYDCLARALTAHAPELAAEDMRLAVRALGRITGRVHVEDLLDIIFRDFCIGK